MHRLRTGLAISLAALLAACGTDYPHVATLSGTAIKTVGSWQPLADDYPQSCHRAWALGATLGPAADTEPCARFVDTQANLTAAFAILSNYFGALGAIATSSNYSVDPGLDALGNTVGKITDAGHAGAAVEVTKLLAKWATGGVRRRSLGDALAQADNVTAIVDGIAHVVVADYQNLLLKGESDQLEVMMGNAAADLRLPPLPPCRDPYAPWGVPQAAGARSTQVMFQSFYNERCTALLARQAAVAAFRTSAADLTAALRQLHANRAQLNKRAAIDAVLKDARTLFADARAVQQAFAAGPSR